jgi:hypothetical protein
MKTCDKNFNTFNESKIRITREKQDVSSASIGFCKSTLVYIREKPGSHGRKEIALALAIFMPKSAEHKQMVGRLGPLVTRH